MELILTTAEELKKAIDQKFDEKFSEFFGLNKFQETPRNTTDVLENYTIKDLVKIFRRTPNTFAAWEKKGWLHPIKMGKSKNSPKTYDRLEVDALRLSNTFDRKKQK